MKKLFISVPMKGRTEENIRKSIEKMHKIAELVFDEKLEIIPSYIEHKPPKDSIESLWYLGESIKKLAEADYFIGINWSEFYKGCNTERSAAMEYGIKSYLVDLSVIPDAYEIERNNRNSCVPMSCG